MLLTCYLKRILRSNLIYCKAEHKNVKYNFFCHCFESCGFLFQNRYFNRKKMLPSSLIPSASFHYKREEKKRNLFFKNCFGDEVSCHQENQELKVCKFSKTSYCYFMVHYVRRHNHINFQVQEKFYSNETEGRKLTSPPKIRVG